ncbi:YraN family protein, partial [Candidatus Saccharibacteria bacterium]|nr:YraN family protein [Candidatus Saccharibacteria bacterium]
MKRNWSCKLGEIDIIAYNENQNTIAFIEVKT